MLPSFCVRLVILVYTFHSGSSYLSPYLQPISVRTSSFSSNHHAQQHTVNQQRRSSWLFETKTSRCSPALPSSQQDAFTHLSMVLSSPLDISQFYSNLLSFSRTTNTKPRIQLASSKSRSQSRRETPPAPLLKKPPNNNINNTQPPSSPSSTPNMMNNNSSTNSTASNVKRLNVQPKSFFSTWQYQADAFSLPSPKLPTLPTSDLASLHPTNNLLQSLQGRNPNDVVTVRDLQQLLNQASTINQPSSISQAFNNYYNPSAGGSLPQTQKVKPDTVERTGGYTGVAFPQKSIVTSRHLQIGTTVSSIFLGMILGCSISPNLWFVSGLLVGSWGYQVAREAISTSPSLTTNKAVLSELILHLGRKVANAYLWILDALNGIWFMYKTGQLSYAYYKEYAQLDQRLGITDKMDAWNARFQEGKLAFDKWERENEIGRKILASLRTAWLVEEKTRKRWSVSNIRVVAYFQSFRRRCQSTTFFQTVNSELQVLWNGIRRSDTGVATRIMAAISAYILFQLFGALFALLPNLLATLAILMGLVWPSWLSELRERVSELRSEWRDREYFFNGSDKLINSSSRINPYRPWNRIINNNTQPPRAARKRSTRETRFAAMKRQQQRKLNPRRTTSPTGIFGWRFWRPKARKIRRTPGKEQWGIWGKF